jgi:5'-nucleotidase
LRVRLLLPILLSSLALPGIAAADGALDILVTNDDGWDAPGIVAVADALRADGHRVTVVAPLAQQSGVGVKITIGEYAVTEQRPGWWSVDGSPADAVSYAVARILSGPPDLVVSGANLGQNLGNNVVSSGTVGACAMALQRALPCIAVSVGMNLAEANAQPERFPSTRAAYPHAARLTARLVAALVDSRAAGTPLLPPQILLNLNYPARPPEDIEGVRLARLSRHGGFRLRYPEVPADANAVSAIEPDPAGLAESDTDTGLFGAGYATLSVLDPDWQGGVTADAVPALAQPLDRLLDR